MIDNLATPRRNLTAALDIGSQRLISRLSRRASPGRRLLRRVRRGEQGFESHRAFAPSRSSTTTTTCSAASCASRRDSRRSAGEGHAGSSRDRAAALRSASRASTTAPSRRSRDRPGARCRFCSTRGGRPELRSLPARGDVRARASACRTTPTSTRRCRAQDETLPGFGPFGTLDTHAFDAASPAYARIEALCRRAPARRAAHRPAVSASDPRAPATSRCRPGELIAWSRILDTEEAVVVVNPNGEARAAAGRRRQRAVPHRRRVPGGREHRGGGRGAGTFTGPHPAGSRVTVRGRRFAGEPSFVSHRSAAAGGSPWSW